MTGRFLVTGATGFIGRYLVDQLLSCEAPVRVLVRQPRRIPRNLRSRLEIVRGDIAAPDVETLFDHAMDGVDTVLHLAACAKAWSRDEDEFHRVNVRAVEAMLAAAARHGVHRLVHVSTILALPPFAAAALNGRAARPTPYETTKLAGDALVEEYAASGHHALIVHPTRVYGPGPLNDANAVTRAIALFLGGKLRVRLADHGVAANYVHAADVAMGILLAAEHGKSGEHYVLGGQNVSFEELLSLVSEITGIERRMVALPRSVALGVAKAAVAWGHIGGTALITPGWVRIFLEDRRADIWPTRLALGYAPRPLRQGIEDTIRWLQGNVTEQAA